LAAHTDANGNPRDWNGIPVTEGGVQAVQQHSNEEANITPEQMNTAVNAARDAFEQTFGDKATQEAIKPPEPEKPKKERD